MTKTKLLISAGLSAFLLVGASAQAQDMSCDDIEFSTAVTSEYPSIADACACGPSAANSVTVHDGSPRSAMTWKGTFRPGGRRNVVRRIS